MGLSDPFPKEQLSQMKTATIILGLAAAASSKFCPGEGGGNQCVAGDNAYKCAVFFDDVTRESFDDLPTCEGKTANARCYTILDRQTDLALDSCDKNLINTRGSQTIGDYLCGQVRRWLRRSDDFKANGIKN